MGNRRLGRKRLYSVNKLGQTNGNAAGGGIVDAVVSNTVRREGHKIITEISVDLGTSKAAVVSVTTDLDIIGVANGLNAALTTLTPAVNGYITYVEMACLEAPTGGTEDIDLYLADEVTTTETSGYLITSATETALITAGGDWTLGAVDHYAVTHGTLFDLGSESNGLYLTCGDANTAATYTAGKFIITLEGYAVPDDK